MSMKRLNRREMLAQSLRLSAGLTFLASGYCAKPEKVAESPRYQFGVCDWSIQKTADPAALELAKSLGFDGVQVSLGTLENDMHLRQKAMQEKYLELSQRLGVEIASLAIGELNNIPYKSDPRAEEWVNDSIAVCQALGVKNVLLAFFGEGDLIDDPAGMDVVVERLKKVAPQAEKAGVNLAIESWLSADDHLKIINQVGSPAVKVYYDVGNSNKKGYNIYQEIEQLKNHICEFHAKDYDDLFGKGSIDFEQVLQSMEKINYHGWIVLEPVKSPLGMEASLQYNLNYLRKTFSV